MKKFSLIAVVLLLATPALAEVLITCDIVDDQVTVSYDSGSDTVRAFALDITVSAGTITAVDPTVDYDPNYNIYPGSIVIVDGEVTDSGTPVGSTDDHPDTLGGIDTDGITIEMGALYAPPIDENGPPSSEQLLVFTISDTGASVTITENEARGGVVLTDGSPAEVNAPGCGAVCFPEGPDYQTWLDVGAPDCWCGSGRQCHGDVDGKEQLVGKYYYWVSNNDLLILADGYGKRPFVLDDPDWDVWICADLDHKEQLVGKYYYRVSNDDLLILAQYYGVRPIDANCLD